MTLGAATGQAIDISVAPDWTKGCQDNPAGSGPAAMLFTGSGCQPECLLRYRGP